MPYDGFLADRARATRRCLFHHGDGAYLDEQVRVDQAAPLHQRARRVVGREELSPHLVDGAEPTYIYREDGDAHDVGQAAAGRFQRRLHVLQHLPGLSLDITSADDLSLPVYCRLPGDEYQPSGGRHDHLGVGACRRKDGIGIKGFFRRRDPHYRWNKPGKARSTSVTSMAFSSIRSRAASKTCWTPGIPRYRWNRSS